MYAPNTPLYFIRVSMSLKNVLLLLCVGFSLSACMGGPVGNYNVPQPAKPIELSQYLGTWYEIARYENSFEKGCAAVTASYTQLQNGKVGVTNKCHAGTPNGPEKIAEGTAIIVPNSQNAKLKVSFFGPFYVGNYWVLDRADNYSWSIVGEPSGKFLWLLARTPNVPEAQYKKLVTRIAALGYDTALLHKVIH